MKNRRPFGATPGQVAIFAAAAAVVAASAISAKTHRAVAPLAMVESPARAIPAVAPVTEPTPVPAPESAPDAGPALAPGVRYFNARPVRPVRTVWMTVTAYSPDPRSCGVFADGVTASTKSIWTNGMNLVAADTRVMPIGTMLSIPGYDSARIVPVLDRGGAIKGHRLDVLFPSHAEALRWGVQRVPVTVWDYAD